MPMQSWLTGHEMTLDMLFETGAWIDKYVKNAGPRRKQPDMEEKK